MIRAAGTILRKDLLLELRTKEAVPAMTLFTINDALLKLASATHPPGQIMAVRGVFAALLTVAVIVAAKQLVHAFREGRCG